MIHMPARELPIAVVGMACRFPGADNLDEYWQLIRDGRSGIAELPPEKLDRELYYDPEHGKLGRTYTTIGGVVPERPIDPLIQRLPKKLLDNADPAHLVLCEVAAAACRHAGYDPFNLPLRNTGVYIGHSGGSVLAGEMAFGNGIEGVAEYLREDPRFQRFAPDLQDRIIRGIVERVHREKPARRPDGGPELAANMVAGVVAEAFGLQGPALATDAACASSLIALAMGVHALRQGLIDMALVGGASCSKWYALVLFSMAQSISATGSRPFDADADGLVSSDGYATVVLKTLPRAMADGDQILGVIRGVGISSDGRGKSLWAPRKEGQILAVQRAYGPDVDPGWLQYIECHATSTQVGDSTELSALTLALRDKLPKHQKLPIGSVKANIGHTLESAGIAGFVKALLCMQHRQIPGQINFHKANPEVPWDDIPFFVPTKTLPWPDPVPGRPRRAAVNAFGIGGLNVHIALDDQPTEALRTQITVPAGVNSRTEPARPRTPSLSFRSDDHAIAIVGASAIFPGALTLQAFWDLLISGRDPLQEVPPGRWNRNIYFDPQGRGRCRTRNTRGGYLTDFVYDWKKHKVPPKQIANANPLQFMLLDAADQALRDAGLDARPFDRQRAAVVVGSVYGGDFACDMQMGLRIPEFQRYLRQEMQRQGVPAAEVEAITQGFQDLLLRHLPALLDETGSFTASTLASRLTKTFDLMGGAFSLDAGDTSSLAAISTAMGMLHDRVVDVVLCAAGQRSMDINVFEALQARHTLAADRPKPAFAADRDGIVPGEGAAVIILKRLADAQRDGDRIRGIIRGFGVSYGAEDYSAAVRQSFQRALTSADVDAAAVEIVESASIGHRLSDQMEAEALTDLLHSPSRTVPAALTSVSAQIGHTLGASGMASLIKACLELEHGQVPGTPGLLQPLPAAVARPDVCRPNSEPQPLFATLPSGKALAAVVNSGANGAVYTLLLEGGQNLPAAPPKTISARPAATCWKTIRLAAATREALLHAVRAAVPHSSRLFAEGGVAQFASSDQARLAIVAESPDTLRRKLELTLSTLERAGSAATLDQQGIFFRELSEGRPQVAFLFPGQGSQYPGMLRELISAVPQAADLERELDAALRREGCPAFAEITANSAEKLGGDVLLTQLAMLAADVLMFRVLQSLGVRPDVIAGHSYGEYPALVAAGALTLADAIRATRERAAAVESQPGTNGSLLSTTAPCELVEALLTHIPGAAYLASHNAPDQTVIGGTVDAIHGVKRLLEADGYVTRVLAVPRPYHTPLLAAAKAPFRQAIAALPVQVPQVRFLSSVSLEYVRSAESVRHNLVEQLTTPVRYVRLVHKLAEEGVSVFIEVGPQQVLSRLNQRILAGRAVTITPTDLPKHPAREGLERVLAAMDVAGVRQPTPSPGPILFFDATQRRKRKAGTAATMPPAAVPISAASTLSCEPVAPAAVAETVVSEARAAADVTIPLDKSAVQAFMIRFVVDQTGYPEDMVELDADLEADLGIDSIKKAQLIGELAENFELKHLSSRLQDLSLDDFRTIRSILDFVTAPAAAVLETRSAAGPESIPAVVAEKPSTPSSPRDEESVRLHLLTLTGTPYEMGRQHGQDQSPHIHTILDRYAALLGPRLQHMPELDEAVARPTMYFGEEELEELQGIADGAGLPLPAVLAENLGMYPDYVPGCTQFAFTRRKNPKFGLVHAVNEDSPLALTLPDCLARVVQVRRPAGGIPHVTFSVSGQTGGLNGINAAGLAISSTLLLDRPRRSSTAIGKIHPVIVKRLLQNAETIDDAVALLRTLDRAGAWSLCLSHFPTDRLCYLEYDGQSLEVQEAVDEVLTTNHCLLQPPLTEVPQHSRLRLARLRQLMAQADQEGVSLEKAQESLRDRFDLGRGRYTPHATMNTIRRVDNQISIVMRPESGELHVTPGPLSRDLADRYFRMELKTLWDEPRRTNGGPHAATESSPQPERIVIPSPPARAAQSVPADLRKGLPPEDQRVVQRHVLRIAEAPLAPKAPAQPAWTGPIILLGQNKLATALRERLQAAGQVVHGLATTGDVDATLAEFERLWQQGPAPHLFLTSARDPEADVPPEHWASRRPIGVWTPFFVCQRWMQLVQEAQLTDRATLVGVTALGGDWGFSGRVHGVEGGGIAGLLKGIRREFPQLCVKVIDAPYQEADDALAGAVLREVSDRTGPLEVGYIRGNRYVVRAIPQPASTQRRGRRRPQGVWVVTGGARGVTAVVARELGRRFGLKLHLLGSTPLTEVDPKWRQLSEEGLKQLKQTISDQARAAGKTPAQAWKAVERALEIERTLQGMRSDGIDVTYHVCDVTQSQELAHTLHRIRQQHGPIRGVIHGAGVEAACRLDKKKRDAVLATLAVKVDAAMTLLALTADDPLDYFVAFGSTSGRFGGLGQTDYSMASDLLVKICDAVRTRRPSVAAIGFHWPPWADVGMAARPESKIALQASRLAFMPPLEGAAHVVDELLSAALEGELLFLDKPDLIDSDKTMPTAAEKAAYSRREAGLREAPLLDTIDAVQEGQSLSATAVFDPTVDPFLLEHRHLGVPILPAVVGLECLAEAAQLLANDHRVVVGVRNLTVHHGLRFHTDVPQRVRITVQAAPDGSSDRCHAELLADFCDRQGRLVEARRRQMDAIIDLGDRLPALEPVALGELPSHWTAHHYVADWRTMKYPDDARVYHGYPFRALRDFALVEDGLWARLVVPAAGEIAGDRPHAGWLLPSATLDAGLLAADLLVWNKWHIADLPHAFERIRWSRPLRAGESLTLRVWLRGRDERSIRTDFVMVDADGQVVLRVDGYEMVEVRSGTGSTPGGATAIPPANEQSAQSSPHNRDASLPAPAPVPSFAAPSRSATALPPTSAMVVMPAPAPVPVRTVKSTLPVNGHRPESLSEPAPAPVSGRHSSAGTPRDSAPPPRAPAQPSSAAANAPTIHTALPASPAAARVDTSELPLIDAATWLSASRLLAEVRFDPVHDPFLVQHKFEGKPLLPAVIGLEAMIEAASLAATDGRLAKVRDFEILAPLRFRDATPQTVRVEVTVHGAAADCRLVGTDDKQTLYQTVRVEWSRSPVVLEAPPPGQPPFPYNPMQYADGAQAQLVHGPLFRGLKALMLMRETGWAKVTAFAADNLAGARRGSRWFLPVATLDSCLVACGVDLFVLMAKRVEIPQRIGELQWSRLPEPNEACVLRLFYRGSDDRHTSYDLVLYGAAGDVVLTVKGYRGVRTSKEADAALWENEFRVS
jgi:acyl transferase domain-containing protein/NAD(P)-dependent dehydrogenase (short-subunit alcohol dehydrogenase family)/acyl carrier protein/3-hydroxymyristoyl/3-hydroxydecanoyl-(acyl carrier protein) dehydratase